MKVEEEEIRAVLSAGPETAGGNLHEEAAGYFAMTLEEETLRGLPFGNVDSILSLGVPRGDLLRILMMPERTYARRKRELMLSPEESDRLVRTARIIALAAEVLESRARAVQWLLRPNGGLGARPVELLATDVGTTRVEQALTQVEYGVYA